MSTQIMTKSLYEQLASFRYKLRVFMHFSENVAKEVGLTPQQHQLLLVIQGYPGRDYATISEAAEKLQITHHACVGLVSRCQKSGLIKRRPNPDDARSILLSLTDKGLELLEHISEIHLKQLHDLQIDLAFFETIH
ncbi:MULTISPECIES: MarR family transcriptional regulator [unclassified Paenibacillus]|uniref:MarR family winged helix-turn-helix transcriptional regulator n=1 Tax=unclassified Paenibacillus TaxID=185978 RepID=UPI00104959E5|nr:MULTISPECIES: MarR family transcriptional regulator [unclassified Paenibacillus]NIK71617.1 DNA-binding MarR family transcriptional regulator [Paenibacillus sp. BK720]TCM96266.1 DNA-binding MarR family transcriptional regulator [Paenibacillus sp. BK033]